MGENNEEMEKESSERGDRPKSFLHPSRLVKSLRGAKKVTESKIEEEYFGDRSELLRENERHSMNALTEEMMSEAKEHAQRHSETSAKVNPVLVWSF